MAVFDAPSRDVCSVLRSTTNTPLQALALMHDPTYIEAARKLAELMIRREPRDHTAQLRLAMRRTLSRAGTGKEMMLLNKLYRQRLARYRSNRAAAKTLLAIGESPTDPKLDPTKVAAMTDVCLAIFNLSETITRK
jgi:hypothetical protein